MRRLVLGGLVLVLLSGVAFAATWGQYQGFSIVRVTIDGQTVQSDVPAINFYGRTMVPLRLISETLGAKVTWDQPNTTAVLESGPTYDSWQLTTSEALDAIAWARACKTVTGWEMLPSYHANMGSGIDIELMTPWACATSIVYREFAQHGQISSVEGLRRDWSYILRVWVGVNGPLPTVQVQLLQAGKTFSPSYVLDPFPSAQEFSFDTGELDKALPVTVTAVINGQTFSHTWELADLK